ncbi:MAG: OPT/YSL family transporter, partial [Planctomycetota bacterium]
MTTDNDNATSSETDQQAETAAPEQLYHPPPGERQLSLRALVAGCLIGGVVSCANIYMGLKIGWSEGGSLIAAILGFSLFAALRQN